MATMSDTASQPFETPNPVIVNPVIVNPSNQKMNSIDPTPKVASDYEKCREERIKENYERMQKLGIYDLSLKLKSIKANTHRKNSKPLSNNQNKTPNRCIAPFPSSVPTRRSSRLQNTPTVSYYEVDLSKKDKDTSNKLVCENSRPEVYTEEHEKLLGDAKTEWTLFVDGYGKDGKKIYDQVRGKTCHQCRQKTLGHRTRCCKCDLVQGQFCGDCLYMRYGENVLEAMQIPDWICPVCRGICNCSLCRQAKGWAPTGIMYRKISSLGYKSVAHYLIQTRRANPDSDKNVKTDAKRSLPFSNEAESEGGIVTNEEIKDEKTIKMQLADESLHNNVKLESGHESNGKNPDEEVHEDKDEEDESADDNKIKVNDESEDENKIKVNDESGDENKIKVNDESEDENKIKVNDESDVKNEDNEVKPTIDTPEMKLGSRRKHKKSMELVLENTIAGRLRSRRKCT